MDGHDFELSQEMLEQFIRDFEAGSVEEQGHMRLMSISAQAYLDSQSRAAARSAMFVPGRPYAATAANVMTTMMAAPTGLSISSMPARSALSIMSEELPSKSLLRLCWSYLIIVLQFCLNLLPSWTFFSTTLAYCFLVVIVPRIFLEEPQERSEDQGIRWYHMVVYPESTIWPGFCDLMLRLGEQTQSTLLAWKEKTGRTLVGVGDRAGGHLVSLREKTQRVLLTLRYNRYNDMVSRSLRSLARLGRKCLWCALVLFWLVHLVRSDSKNTSVAGFKEDVVFDIPYFALRESKVDGSNAWTKEDGSPEKPKWNSQQGPVTSGPGPVAEPTESSTVDQSTFLPKTELAPVASPVEVCGLVAASKEVPDGELAWCEKCQGWHAWRVFGR